jgi:hypothetical protein
MTSTTATIARPAADLGRATLADVCVDVIVETADRLVADNVARWEILDSTTTVLVADDHMIVGREATVVLVTAYHDVRDVDLSAEFWQLHEHY